MSEKKQMDEIPGQVWAFAVHPTVGVLCHEGEMDQFSDEELLSIAGCAKEIVEERNDRQANP